MKKSLRKAKKCSLKTVKAFSTELDDSAIASLDKLFASYGRCRATFSNELCGINNLERVSHFRDIRDEKRKQGLNVVLTKKYDFQGKHWVYALRDTCSNLHSMWSSTANKIRKVIQANDNFTKEERHFLYFTLGFDHLWLGVL